MIAYNYYDFDWRKEPVEASRHFILLRLSRLYPALLLFYAIFFKHVYVDAHAFGSFGLRWLLPSFGNLLSIESWYPIKHGGS